MTPGQSLVRYDNPVLVSRSDAATATKKDAKAVDGKKPPIAGGQKKLPPVDDKRAKTPSQTEDILNSILPPRFLMSRLTFMTENGMRQVNCGFKKFPAHQQHVWM